MIIIEDYMRDEMHLSGAKLFVYAALCGHVQNGFSTVTQEQLAAELGLGLRTVTRAFAELKEDKFIKIKPFRDNGKKRNSITLNDIHFEMNHNKVFQEVLVFWNDKIGLNEVMTIDIYKKLQRYIKQDKYIEVIKNAIERYAMILNDKLYYKSHIYKFSSFLNKIEDYLKSGIEWREYCADYNKRYANKWTASDRDIDPLEESKKNNTLSIEELGTVEM